jgi:hypothetical protein
MAITRLGLAGVPSIPIFLQEDLPGITGTAVTKSGTETRATGVVLTPITGTSVTQSGVEHVATGTVGDIFRGQVPIYSPISRAINVDGKIK